MSNEIRLLPTRSGESIINPAASIWLDEGDEFPYEDQAGDDRHHHARAKHDAAVRHRPPSSRTRRTQQRRCPTPGRSWSVHSHRPVGGACSRRSRSSRTRLRPNQRSRALAPATGSAAGSTQPRPRWQWPRPRSAREDQGLRVDHAVGERQGARGDNRYYRYEAGTGVTRRAPNQEDHG